MHKTPFSEKQKNFSLVSTQGILLGYCFAYISTTRMVNGRQRKQHFYPWSFVIPKKRAGSMAFA